MAEPPPADDRATWHIGGPPRRTINDLLDEARQGLVRLTPEQTVAAMAEGALVIDVRPPHDRERTGVIPGSVHFHRGVVEWRVDAASGSGDPLVTGLDQHLILVCNEGYTSSLAAATLQQLGFTRATDLIGGVRAWREAGLPVVMPGPNDHTFTGQRQAYRAPDVPLPAPAESPGLNPRVETTNPAKAG